MARDPRTSQYAPGPAEPVIDEWSNLPDFVVVVDRDLRDAEREALYRIAAALGRYEPIRASGSLIQLSRRDGTIVMAGRVRSQPLKTMAERLAVSAAGDQRFSSELVADADLVFAVATALATDPRTNLAPVYVEASLGHLTLGGDVPSAEMAAAAPEIASAVPGVGSVRSQLVVKVPPPPRPAEPKAEPAATARPPAAATPRPGAAAAPKPEAAATAKPEAVAAARPEAGPASQPEATAAPKPEAAAAAKPEATAAAKPGPAAAPSAPPSGEQGAAPGAPPEPGGEQVPVADP